LTSALDCSDFEEKIAVVHHAVPPRPFTKTPGRGPVRLLFVGSGNIKGEFEIRGGWEVFETFIFLRRRYPDLELVIRSDLPAAMPARYRGLPGVRILDKVVPWATLEHEFRTADIFLLPSHGTPPFLMMDAMSYELPVVGLDVWANGEIVEHGRTGLLVKPSTRMPYYYRHTWNPNFGAPEFRRALRQPDPAIVADLASAVTCLIESPDLRRQMGRTGRWEVEQGRLSIADHNTRLRHFFDNALPGATDFW
jgi:glycosyltransferase involved in cell wall biosynthesis